MMFEKLFKWNVPQALTSADWRSWHVNQRRERPVAYWFCETLPNWVAPIRRRFTDFPYNMRMKYITRYNIIRTGLTSAYHDGDTRMLHGMFAILVDFVEIEKAHSAQPPAHPVCSHPQQGHGVAPRYPLSLPRPPHPSAGPGFRHGGRAGASWPVKGRPCHGVCDLYHVMAPASGWRVRVVMSLM